MANITVISIKLTLVFFFIILVNRKKYLTNITFKFLSGRTRCMVNHVGTYSTCGLLDVVYQSVPKLATKGLTHGKKFCTVALTCLEGGGFDPLRSSKGWGI